MQPVTAKLSNSYFSLCVIFHVCIYLLWYELLINSWLLHVEPDRLENMDRIQPQTSGLMYSHSYT